MFNAVLEKIFQEPCVDQILELCKENEQIVLSAPTGSGKTVIACKFIDDYLDENPSTVFLWLCPGAGGLETQSQESFENLTQGIPDGDVYDFINESNPRGNIYFINWDKINRASNVVLREGERKDLFAQIHDCHRNNIPIFVIVDEEHRYQETANEFILQVQPQHVLRISATPISGDGMAEVKVTEEQVIGAQLISKEISINEGVERALQENNQLDDDLMLIELADKKRLQIWNEYKARHLPIRPLVLIQFPNGNEEWIERVKNRLTDMGYPESSGMVTQWFSGDHPDNVEEIKKLDGQYAFLLFKQAIATGWDCPRAKILVKLREGGTEAFNIQTIGRIRRMPERHYYDSEILDRCYLYTLDSEFSEGLTRSVNDAFYSYLYKLKRDIKNVKLQREELDGNDKYVINPEAVVKVIRKRMLQECDLDGNGKLDRHELELAKGYVFGTKLKTEALVGVARTTKDIKKLNPIFAGEHQINTHDDGFIIRDAKRRIARAARLEENISNNVLQILFGPVSTKYNIFSEPERKFEEDNKLINDFNYRDYNAFLVNNKDRLIEVFADTNANEIAEIERAETKSKDWHIPETQYYRQHKNQPDTTYLTKNAFDLYGKNILIQPNRSHSEIVFENWCENSNDVEWVYKNGDKGSDYFCIVYEMAFVRAHFYPDYILKMKNGNIWIIEAKGGETADGTSANIDRYAKRKFEALKKYGDKHQEIKWCFARAIGEQLYVSNTKWDENVANHKVWVTIEGIVK
jgi:type III restriction enzyme